MTILYNIVVLDELYTMGHISFEILGTVCALEELKVL